MRILSLLPLSLILRLRVCVQDNSTSWSFPNAFDCVPLPLLCTIYLPTYLPTPNNIFGITDAHDKGCGGWGELTPSVVPWYLLTTPLDHHYHLLLHFEFHATGIHT